MMLALVEGNEISTQFPPKSKVPPPTMLSALAKSNSGLPLRVLWTNVLHGQQSRCVSNKAELFKAHRLKTAIQIVRSQADYSTVSHPFPYVSLLSQLLRVDSAGQTKTFFFYSI